MNLKTTSPKTVFLGSRTFLLPDRIAFLEACANYTIVHDTSGSLQLLSTTIKDVMKCLEGEGDFVRISRKHAVNIAYVKEKKETGLLLKNNIFLMPSRRKKKELSTLFVNS